jgi:hypothetical protein
LASPPHNWIHHQEKSDGADSGGDEDHQQRARGTKRRPHHRHQCLVAKTHGFLFQDHLAQPPDDPDGAGANTCPKERVPRLRKRRDFAAQGAQHCGCQDEKQTEHRKAIRNQVRLCIRNRDPQHDGAEYRNSNRRE